MSLRSRTSTNLRAQLAAAATSAGDRRFLTLLEGILDLVDEALSDDTAATDSSQVATSIIDAVAELRSSVATISQQGEAVDRLRAAILSLAAHVDSTASPAENGTSLVQELI